MRTPGRRFRSLACAVVPVLLAACSLSGAVQRDTVDYNHAIEDVTNQLIVTNILRARDHAPLHFTDLSLIHGSLQISTTGNAVVPFGQGGNTTVRPRDLLTLGTTVQSSPAFDTSPLNSSGFTEGLLSPVPFKYFRYYLDRGVPQALLLNLLVEKISLTRNGPPPVMCDYRSVAITPNRVLADPGTTPPCPPPGYENIATFQDLVRSWTKPILINDYDQISPFGPPLTLNPHTSIRDLATAGSSSLVLRQRHDGRYQFYKSKARTAICLPAGPGYVVSAVAGDTDTTSGGRDLADVCYRREVERENESVNDEGPQTAPPGARALQPHIRRMMYLRSVKGVIEYLGEVSRLPAGVPRPIPFYIRPGQDLGAPIGVYYDGEGYHVDAFQAGTDETMLVLSIVNDLLNLIKKASEVPTTPSVQVLQ